MDNAAIYFSALIIIGCVVAYYISTRKQKPLSPKELEKQRLQEEWKEQQKGYKNN